MQFDVVLSQDLRFPLPQIFLSSPESVTLLRSNSLFFVTNDSLDLLLGFRSGAMYSTGSPSASVFPSLGLFGDLLMFCVTLLFIAR